MVNRKWLVLAVVAGTFVATVAPGLGLSRTGPESYDAKIMLQVTESLVERGDFRVTEDEFGVNTPYASYGPGMSLLFAVPYVLAPLAGWDRIKAVGATNAFVLAFALAAVLYLARRLDLTWAKSLLLALLTGAATMMLPYVQTGFSELAVAALVAVGLAAVAAARQGRQWAALVGGTAAGAAVLFRTDSALLVMPALGVGIWFAAGRGRVAVARFVVGAAPFLLFLAWYNNLRFGSPFRLGYGSAENRLIFPFWQGLHGLLWSPSRGLIWFVPLVIVAVIGAPRAWRRDPVLTATAAAILLGRPLLFARWSQWWGGVCWGPRFLLPAMPALAIGVAEVVRRFGSWRLPVRIGLVAVIATSGAVQIAGTMVGYEHHWNRYQPVAVAAGDSFAYLYAWKYFPILQQAKWALTEPDIYVGRAMPPRLHPKYFGSLATLSLLGAAAAVTGARRLDREPSPRVRPDSALAQLSS